jgi:hypothetical protein
MGVSTVTFMTWLHIGNEYSYVHDMVAYWGCGTVTFMTGLHNGCEYSYVHDRVAYWGGVQLRS